MNLERKNNGFKLKENGDELNIELFKNSIIRIYKIKNDTSLYSLNLKEYSKEVELNKLEKEIILKYEGFDIVFTNINSFSIYKNDKLITKIDLKIKYDDYEKKNYFSTNLLLNNSSHVFGLGDKMASLNKVGYYYKSHNTDDPLHQDELFYSLYKSINYCLFENNLNYIGLFFPSTYLYTYDIGKTDLNNFSINNFNEDIDMFLVLGDNPKQITKNYSSLVGHPYFISLKTLGYTQSRWSYENEMMVKEVFDNFKKYDLPLDYIDLDIHYMEGYRDFTVDKTRFPNLKELSNYLKEGDVELVTINDAAIKEDYNFKIFKYLDKNKLFALENGKTYINEVWPGKSGFPNYFSKKGKKYFEKIASTFLNENGISGIWCDMNEPASFKGELPANVEYLVGDKTLLHEQVHNIYGEHMVKSFIPVFTKNNVRPYLFSRAAFATTAKYAFVWNGDNHSLWHHLKLSLPQIMSLSICNFMVNGVDIGGFGGDCNKQLLIRWLEANLFSPYFRNHSSLNTIHQEPYAFDKETLDIYRKYLKIRYDFTPYLYNLVYLMNKKGETIVSPLFIHYPLDENGLLINDEYMVGDSLLVAPIVDQDKFERIVYFPKGKWVNYFNNKVYYGNKSYIVKMNLDESGYFIKYNSIIPQFKNLNHLNKEKIDTLVLKIYGENAKCFVYEDDGITLNYKKGKYNMFKINFKNNKFTFKTIKQDYDSTFKKIIIMHNETTKEVRFTYNFELSLEDK